MANGRIRHWTVRHSRRRVAGYWEIRNTTGIVGICYRGKDEAECMASAPRVTAQRNRAVAELKHLIAIVRLREGDLRASERAALARAEALVSEINGGN